MPGTGSRSQLALEPGTSGQQNFPQTARPESSARNWVWEPARTGARNQQAAELYTPSAQGVPPRTDSGNSLNWTIESAVAEAWFYAPLPAWCKTQEPASTGRPTCDILDDPPFRPSESISGPPRFPNLNNLGPFPPPPHYHPQKI